MSDSIKFSLLILLGVVGVYAGLFGVRGESIMGSVFHTSLSNTRGFWGNESLLASAASVIGGTKTDSNGTFLVSFDSLETAYEVVLPASQGLLRIYDMQIDKTTHPATIYIGTNKGLYMSDDRGFTWHTVLSSHKTLSYTSAVLRILPVRAHTALVSIFSDGIGYVYETTDDFFTMRELIRFEGEGAYDMYMQGDRLYLGMSNGQIIRYQFSTETFQVTHTFSDPVVRIYTAHNGYYYIHLKSGKLMRTTNIEGTYTAVYPRTGLFSSRSVDAVVCARNGTMYVLRGNDVYKSVSSGDSFELLDKIPLLEKRIDAIGVSNTTLYILSMGRLYISTDEGVSWKLRDVIPSGFSVQQFYDLGDGRIIISE